MSDMKCPFCGQKLGRKNINDRMCSNEKCVTWKGNFYGSEDLWQEFIRTRKALDVAVDVLKEIDKTRSVASHKIGTPDKTLNAGIMFCWTTPDQIHNALAEITVLEQKDK